MTPSEGYAVVPDALTAHARQLNTLADEMQAITDAAHTKMPGDALGEVGQSFTSLMEQFVTAGARALQSGINAMQATGTGVQSNANTLEQRESTTAATFGGQPAAETTVEPTRSPQRVPEDSAHLQLANYTAPPAGPVPSQSESSWSQSPARTWDLHVGDDQWNPAGSGPGTPSPMTADARAQLADQLTQQSQISPAVADLAVGLAPAGTNRVIIGEPGVGAAVQFYNDHSIPYQDRDESGQIRSDMLLEGNVREPLGQRDVAVLGGGQDGLWAALADTSARFGGQPGELWIQVPEGRDVQAVFKDFMSPDQADTLDAATRNSFSNIDVTFMTPEGIVLGTVSNADPSVRNGQK
ncbi:hypothetical protein JOF56_007970 [Kibdelosporangium banguiense]|uniref:WXG100 family type VII secretion target n=1 Tax=Kibdelosporangium banguiense TaxID=1365924 RepID=A0ABS4TT56_9PSEU|nr:hypothetical protein [Kibdelosporangium banguiense]MBP2327585.1 hypothetical protein [Kibdelosporangium banguiense]